MKQKRILALIPTLGIGGAEHLCVNIVNFLFDKGQDIYLYTLTEKRDLLPKLKLPAHRVANDDLKECYLGRETVLNSSSAAQNLAVYCEKNEIDTVVAVLPFSHFIARLAKKRLANSANEFRLLTYYCALDYSSSSLNASLLKRAFNYYNMRLAKAFDDISICVSKAVMKDIEDNFYLADPHVIFNSVPAKKGDSELAERLFKEWGFDPGEFLLIFPGRLHPAKAHDFFLDAFDEFLHSISETDRKGVRLLIVGGGLLEQEIKRQIENYSWKDQVLLTGFVDNFHMLSYMKRADLVVVPSRFEGFGNVAIEAMVQGVTLLCSTAGGLKEVVIPNYNAYQFIKEDKSDLIDKLLYIYENREDIEVSAENQLADYEARFSLSAQAKQLIAIV